MKSTMITTTICLLVLAGLCGCGNEYIRKHPELSDEMKNDIKNHIVKRGMTKEQVIASIGSKPAKRTTLDGKVLEEGDEPFRQVWHWYSEKTEMKMKPETYSSYDGFGIGFSLGSERTGEATQYSILFHGDKMYGLKESKGYLGPGNRFVEIPEMPRSLMPR